MGEIRKYNRMDRASQRKLEDLVFANADSIKAGKWSRKTFLDHAEHKIGMPLTFGNLTGAMKVFGLEFHRSSNGSSFRNLRQL